MDFLQSLQLETYAGYVWSCYGITLVALVGLAVATRQQWRTALRVAQRRSVVHSSETQS